ncbi:MAG: hypothetical protein KGN84_15730, partial [Acidobacteriota bacterium]|nr:hypothetical protein [Acidobacteriota bacterium]
MARAPWLTYWLAVCSLVSRPDIAATKAREAMVAFRGMGDLVGELAAWSVEALTVTVRMGDLSPLDELIQIFPCQLPADLPLIPRGL